MKKINEFKMTIDSKSINECFTRVVVSAFVTPLDPNLEEIADIKTAISEAVTNCIVHAYKDTYGKIFLTGVIDDKNNIKFTVKDKGCGIENIEQAMTPLLQQGRATEPVSALRLRKAFAIRVKVYSEKGKGTTVTLIKKIEGKAKW